MRAQSFKGWRWHWGLVHRRVQSGASSTADSKSTSLQKRENTKVYTLKQWKTLIVETEMHVSHMRLTFRGLKRELIRRLRLSFKTWNRKNTKCWDSNAILKFMRPTFEVSKRESHKDSSSINQHESHIYKSKCKSHESPVVDSNFKRS